MICRSCMRAALRTRIEPPKSALQSLRINSSKRTLSTTSSNAATISPNDATASAPRQGSPSSSHNPPAATSTAAAQPFSATQTPSAKNQDLPISHGKPSAVPVAVRSSCAAGTVLKGLNFVKGKQDPVALEDSEYPAWLWEILNEKEGGEAAGGAAEGDLFSKSKKQRRLAAKAQRKQLLLNPEGMAPKIPIYEQSIDLPSGDGSLQGAVEADQARETLTKAMRAKRRSAIKEDNYLRSMT